MTAETNDSIADPEDVLAFWFGGAASDREALQQRNRLWFQGGAPFDGECTKHFGASLAAAADGRLDHWTESPRSRLALIVLLDQFSRNIYRGII